jgi:hypothetical protein
VVHGQNGLISSRCNSKDRKFGGVSLVTGSLFGFITAKQLINPKLHGLYEMFNLRYLSGQGPSDHHALKLKNSTNPWFNALVQPSFILIVLWIRVRHQCEWMIVNGFSQNLLRLQYSIQTCKQSYGHGNMGMAQNKVPLRWVVQSVHSCDAHWDITVLAEIQMTKVGKWSKHVKQLTCPKVCLGLGLSIAQCSFPQPRTCLQAVV